MTKNATGIILLYNSKEHMCVLMAASKKTNIFSPELLGQTTKHENATTTWGYLNLP